MPPEDPTVDGLNPLGLSTAVPPAQQGGTVAADAEPVTVYSYRNAAGHKVYVVEETSTTAGGVTTVTYQAVQIFVAVDRDGDDGTGLTTAQAAATGAGTPEGVALAAGIPTTVTLAEGEELVHVTAELPEQEAYDHIHFGVWASLGKAAASGTQEIADLGIGFVQSIGDGLTPVEGENEHLPATGTATYNGNWVAAVQEGHQDSDGRITLEDGAATLIADFGKDDISVTLTGLANLEGEISGNTFSGEGVEVLPENSYRLTPGRDNFDGSLQWRGSTAPPVRRPAGSSTSTEVTTARSAAPLAATRTRPSRSDLLTIQGARSVWTGRFSCVPSMTDSLEVQVLYPARWRRRISEAQGRRREAWSEGSVEQSRDPMDKNRIRGLPGRTSGQVTAKSIAIKGRGGKSGGVCGGEGRSVLPREVCVVSGIPGLSGSARTVIAAQKSAEGIVVDSLTKARTTDRVSRPVRSLQAKRQNIQLELALEPVVKGEARSPGPRGTEACMARADPERPAAGRGPSMEEVVEPGNPEEGAGACSAQQGGARHRRHDRRRTGRLSEGPLARDEVPTSRRHL